MARPPKEKRSEKSTTEEQTQTQSTNYEIGSCSYSSPLDLPIGYRFAPKEEEPILILHQWKQNSCFNHPAVHHVNIYESNPQQLSERFEKGNDENEWFFISKRTKLCNGGKNLKRGNSEGYWEARSAARRINAGQGVIGYRTVLNYYVGKQPNGVETKWRMHEYSFKSSHHDKDKVDYALCKIFQSTREAKKKISMKKEEELAMVDHAPQVFAEDIQQSEYQQQSLMMQEEQQQTSLMVMMREAEEQQQMSLMMMMPEAEEQQQQSLMMMMQEAEQQQQQQSLMMMMPELEDERQQSQMMMMPELEDEQQRQQRAWSLPPLFPQDLQVQDSAMEMELTSQSNDNNNIIPDDEFDWAMNIPDEEFSCKQ